MSSSPPARMPTYFLGIGGPSFIENTNHPAYHQLAKVGLEITTNVKPKAVVVFSAHWSESSCIKINAATHTDLIYDFYGFPPHYYEYDYPHKGSPEVADKVSEKLEEGGFEVEKVERGLDHGVWAGFMVAFDPKKNPLNAPIIQVSLYGEDPDEHYRIGQAVQGLRDEGILIIGAGMAVHNLGDYRKLRQAGSDTTLDYVVRFDEALRDAATTAQAQERQAKMAALMKTEDARRSHPTVEHILPLYVSAGAGGLDSGVRLWTMQEGSLSWAQYRFGGIRK